MISNSNTARSSLPGDVAGRNEGVADVSEKSSITIRGLTKVYETARGSVNALTTTSLDIRAGEFICVVGPSGCGKTTMMNILAGLEEQTSGTVEFQAAEGSRPLRAVVFQEQSVFPWRTVLDNAAFGLEARGMGKKERRERTLQVLKRMGLQRFADSYPSELSGGMRQRVNIARAFAIEPHILLMDEPFGSLDEQTKLLMQNELLSLWEGSGQTVIFITHSIEEAIRLADRILVMSARPGRVKAAIDVNIPHPRHVMDLVDDEEFSRLRHEVWELLREEVMAAREVDLGDDNREDRR